MKQQILDFSHGRQDKSYYEVLRYLFAEWFETAMGSFIDYRNTSSTRKREFSLLSSRHALSNLETLKENSLDNFFGRLGRPDS